MNGKLNCLKLKYEIFFPEIKKNIYIYEKTVIKSPKKNWKNVPGILNYDIWTTNMFFFDIKNYILKIIILMTDNRILQFDTYLENCVICATIWIFLFV